MSTAQIDPQEIRDAFDKIAANVYPVPHAIASIRVDHAKAARAYIASLEAANAKLQQENAELAAELESRAPPPSYQIDTRRDRPSDAALILNRMKRLRDEDARAAGQRECL